MNAAIGIFWFSDFVRAFSVAIGLDQTAQKWNHFDADNLIYF